MKNDNTETEQEKVCPKERLVMWVIYFIHRIRNIMKTYYWQMKRKNGSLVEGKFSLFRRVFGRVFLGETYEIIGEWQC